MKLLKLTEYAHILQARYFFLAEENFLFGSLLFSRVAWRPGVSSCWYCLVQQLPGIWVRAAPEAPVAFPLGSKMVVSVPSKKTEEARGESRACPCEGTSF